MSDLWFNIALGKWHIQGEYGSLWLHLSKNPHVPDRPWYFVGLFELRWPWPGRQEKP